MSHRPYLLAANWKMNPPPAGWDAPNSPYRPHANVDVVVLPSFLDIKDCITAKLTVGAQWGSSDLNGAHTGDVSMTMLKAAGCHYVLCGHSERRRDHMETDDTVIKQTIAALEAGLHPIVCIGETDTERAKNRQKTVIKRQVMAVPHGNLTFAYEPVWAIGTGNTATPEQVQEMHVYIRSLLPVSARNDLRLLYGGSTNAMNTRQLLSLPDVDGLLVGGCSLKPQEFKDMVAVAAELTK